MMEFVLKCDKLVMVVSQTKLTTFVTIDVPRQKFFESTVCDKDTEGTTLISVGTHIPYIIVQDKWRVDTMPNKWSK